MNCSDFNSPQVFQHSINLFLKNPSSDIFPKHDVWRSRWCARAFCAGMLDGLSSLQIHQIGDWCPSQKSWTFGRRKNFGSFSRGYIFFHSFRYANQPSPVHQPWFLPSSSSCFWFCDLSLYIFTFRLLRKLVFSWLNSNLDFSPFDFQYPSVLLLLLMTFTNYEFL